MVLLMAAHRKCQRQCQTHTQMEAKQSNRIQHCVYAACNCKYYKVPASQPAAATQLSMSWCASVCVCGVYLYAIVWHFRWPLKEIFMTSTSSSRGWGRQRERGSAHKGSPLSGSCALKEVSAAKFFIFLFPSLSLPLPLLPLALFRIESNKKKNQKNEER